MPGGEQGAAGGLRLRHQIVKLRQGGGGRLLDQHMLAGAQGLHRQAVADGGRGAQRHGVQAGQGRQHLRLGAEGRHAVRGAAVRADHGGELEQAGGGDGRDVLVAGDLSQTDEAEGGERHGDCPVGGRPQALPLL